jgi:hypothetical protein
MNAVCPHAMVALREEIGGGGSWVTRCLVIPRHTVVRSVGYESAATKGGFPPCTMTWQQTKAQTEKGERERERESDAKQLPVKI